MRLGRALTLLAAGLLSGLALVASAAGTTSKQGTKVRHLQQPVASLAVDGDRIAYDLTASDDAHARNRVLVWNVRTGKTLKVSGPKTAVADFSGTGSGVFQLAIAGKRVAWLLNEGGNLEGDDYLYTSSLVDPKERKVASDMRLGDGCPGRGNRCAGQWLGGLVGAGNLIVANRWTTDVNNTVTAGQLDVLSGSKLKHVATGADTVQAAAADGGRVAVLRADGDVALYSAAGKLLLTVSPQGAIGVALSGKRLVVATQARQLELYNARTGSLEKTISARGTGPRLPRNLDVQGNIAIYTTGNAGVLHAVNLTTGKDRALSDPHGGVDFAHIDSAGLAYANNGSSGKSFSKATLVFKPLSLAKAAVG
jgi:hypothetical protein